MEPTTAERPRPLRENELAEAEPCRACKGLGFVHAERLECPSCGGSGLAR